MSTIGKNIKKIRVVKKMSQAQFAELFNLARPSVGAYEEGRSEPKIDNVIQIARYFGISIDSLLTKELTINDLYKFDLRTGELTKSDIEPGEPSNYHSSTIESALVQVAKHFEYIVQMNNKDFIASLPRIHVAGFEGKDYRAFEASNAEMYDQYIGINQGDYVIGKKIKDLTAKSFEPNKVYILVFENGIFIRRVERINNEVHFIPDNPNHQSIAFETSGLLEGWQAVGYFTKDLKKPSVISSRLLTLENTIKGLEKRLDNMEKK